MALFRLLQNIIDFEQHTLGALRKYASRMESRS